MAWSQTLAFSKNSKTNNERVDPTESNHLYDLHWSEFARIYFLQSLTRRAPAQCGAAHVIRTSRFRYFR